MGVADEEVAVVEELDPQRTSAGVRDPLDLPAVGAEPEDRAVLGAGVDVAVGRDDDVLGSGTGHGVDGEGHGVMLAYVGESRKAGTMSAAALERSRPRASAGSTNTIRRPSWHSMSSSVRSVAATKTCIRSKVP